MRTYVRLGETQKQQLIDRYVHGETCENLAVDFGVSRGTAHNIVVASGVNRPSRTNHFNERFFEAIDSEIKAYWLGFLYADGNVYKNTLGVALAACDLDHIIKLKAALGSSSEPVFRNSNNSWAIKFHSQKLIGDLANFGLVPCKSHIITTPNVKSDLLHHFYRGYFDGDGWLTFREKRKTWSLGVVSGSRIFVHEIQRWLGERIKSKANVVDKSTKNAYQIVFEGNRQVKKAVEILYDDSHVHLDRKYKNAMEICK